MNRKVPGAITANAHNRFVVYRREHDAEALQSPRTSATKKKTMLDKSETQAITGSVLDRKSLAAECVRNSPLFAGLQPDAQREIAARATERSFVTQQPIFREDDTIRYVHILNSGTVKSTRLTEAGSEVILRVDRAYTPIDDMCSSHAKTHTTNAVAITDCCILTWHAHEFQQLAQRFPAIRRNAARIMQRRLISLEKSFCDLSTARVPQRLARVLLQFGGDKAAHHDGVGFSRQELAQMAGTSPFMISRLLSAWAERGIVSVNRSQVTIGDVASLVRLSEGSSN